MTLFIRQNKWNFILETVDNKYVHQLIELDCRILQANARPWNPVAARPWNPVSARAKREAVAAKPWNQPAARPWNPVAAREKRAAEAVAARPWNPVAARPWPATQ